MKRASIRDVARAAGVSITTVSKALNNYPDVNSETRKRIQELAEQMKYVPDIAGRSMGGIREKTICLLVNDLRPSDPSGAIFGTLSGVCTACKENNIHFMLMTTDPVSQVAIPLDRFLMGRHLSGLICVGFRIGDPYLSQMNDLELPCALIDIETDSPHIVSITLDDVSASDQAVSYLISSGRQRIAFINGLADADVSIRRDRGFRSAMRRAGLIPDETMVRNCNFEEDLSYAAAVDLLQTDPVPDSFFCASDLMAFGVCRAIEESGRTLGKDISVVGFDDIPTAKYLFGGLTTIRQNFYVRGHQAGDAVFHWIREGTPPPQAQDSSYELVLRKTA